MFGIYKENDYMVKVTVSGSHFCICILDKEDYFCLVLSGLEKSFVLGEMRRLSAIKKTDCY